MIRTVIVGDEPSKTNVSTDIAFVGSKSFNRLVEWIKFIKPDYYICLNSDTISQLSDIRKLQKDGFKVIALGNKASSRLKDISHLKIDHPSGLNRKTNNIEYIIKMLNNAYNYIRSVK